MGPLGIEGEIGSEVITLPIGIGGATDAIGNCVPTQECGVGVGESIGS